MKALLILLIISASANAADRDRDAECLSKIMFAEAKGESVAGVVAVGDAAKQRAADQNKPVCKITGVKQQSIPEQLRAHFLALAKSVLNSHRSTVAGANAWNTGTKPRQTGEITRQIEQHVFYIVKAEPEKRTKP